MRKSILIGFLIGVLILPSCAGDPAHVIIDGGGTGGSSIITNDTDTDLSGLLTGNGTKISNITFTGSTTTYLSGAGNFTTPSGGSGSPSYFANNPSTTVGLDFGYNSGIYDYYTVKGDLSGGPIADGTVTLPDNKELIVIYIDVVGEFNPSGTGIYYWIPGDTAQAQYSLNLYVVSTESGTITILQDLRPLGLISVSIPKPPDPPGDYSLPSPDESWRGKIFTVYGYAGVADVSYICQKTVLDTYVWNTITVTP